MKKLVDPVIAGYAKEIGADGIYAKINAHRNRRSRRPAETPHACRRLFSALRLHEARDWATHAPARSTPYHRLLASRVLLVRRPSRC